jgi:hypothetical protein
VASANFAGFSGHECDREPDFDGNRAGFGNGGDGSTSWKGRRKYGKRGEKGKGKGKGKGKENAERVEMEMDRAKVEAKEAVAGRREGIALFVSRSRKSTTPSPHTM